MAGPADGGDEVVFGGRRYRTRSPRPGSWQAYLVIGALVAAASTVTGLLLTIRGDHQVPARFPQAISVVNENVLTMRLTKSSGGELWVRYLRVDHGPSTIWLDLIVTGLPEGFDYEVTAGDCVKGHPRRLSISLGIPDHATGILTLALDNLPAASLETNAWVRVANVYGAQLGGIRDSLEFLGDAPVVLGPRAPTCS